MFGTGSFGGDMSASAARDFAYVRARNEVSAEYEERIERLNGVVEREKEYAAECVAMRAALNVQLERFNPQNPLLKDESLIQRIKNAAKSAFRTNGGKSYAVPREVGRTFRIPGHEGPVAAPPPTKELVKPPVLLKKDDVKELQDAYAGMLALRMALTTQLKKFDLTNPLLNDIMLEERVRKAGRTAFALNNDDFSAAREAGKTFQIPGRD